MLVWFRDTFGNIRVYITENGAAFYDPPQPGPDGIDDPLRCDYLRTHIAAIGDAIERGVDVRGYMVWRSEEHTSELQSLMRISYAVFCLKKKKKKEKRTQEKKSKSKQLNT